MNISLLVAIRKYLCLHGKGEALSQTFSVAVLQKGLMVDVAVVLLQNLF